LRIGGLAALLLLAALLGTSVMQQSLVGDAPYHLLAGHQALRYGENRLNLEHPPLVKLVAALPLMAEGPLAPPTTVDGVLETSLQIFDDPARLERVRIASRTLLLLVFGLPFLTACYLLGREVGGRRTGSVLALSVGLALPVLPNLSIVQTDTAVSLGFTLTMAAALRYLKRADGWNLALLGLGLGLALASKFSGVLLAPAVVLCLLIAPLSWHRRLRALLLVSLFAGAIAYLPYSVANFDYDPVVGRATIHSYCQGEALIVDHQMQKHENFLMAVEKIDPNLAQWLTGLLGIRIQNDLGVYPSYAFGHLSSLGRWWYFPAVLLVKTPLILLLASVAAGLAFWKTKKLLPLAATAWAVLLATVGTYLLVAMTSNYNLGVRHLMPVLPLLYLPAAHWAAARKWRAALVIGVLACEALAVAPLWMSATNTWWLGEHNPTRFALSASDIEYHQNFRALAHAVDERGIDRLHLLFPLVNERELSAYLPKAVLADPNTPPEPGWYAVSVTMEQFLPTIPRTPPENLRCHARFLELVQTWKPLWQRVREGEDHGYVAATFHLYYLDNARETP
jgi:4-amino-4-deoxy-L-arabinose transferase-like glycosyltransferase